MTAASLEASQALIAKLEAAQEGSRELNKAIWRQKGLTKQEEFD